MRVIFLDKDGVVNTVTKNGMQMVLPFLSKRGKYYHNTYFDPKVIPNFVNLLNYCREKDVKIVISSSWRHMGEAVHFNEYYDTYFQLNQYSKIEDLSRNIVIGITDKNFDDRADQIKKYLNEHPEITEFVIIDDDYFNFRKTFPLYNFIRINPRKGLQNYHLLLMKLSFKWQEFKNKLKRGK